MGRRRKDNPRRSHQRRWIDPVHQGRPPKAILPLSDATRDALADLAWIARAVASRMADRFPYAWANNPKRAAMKGRTCELLARGSLNSALIRFVDNGQIEVVSRNALRRPAKGTPQ